ncbi:MAG: hypothetical protein JWO65_1354 [Sphingomonas bacterium]|nr:hypothetical protein [Sphingomonas bacterium]
MRSERVLAVVAMAFACLAGLYFRVWHVAGQPFWLDEAYSAYAADHGFAFLWNVVPRYETHPPFYYALLRIWSLAIGDSLSARRALGLACGAATIPIAGYAAAMLARLIGWSPSRSRRLVGFTVILMSLHPFAILMSRQVRPYPVMILVYAGAILLLLRIAIESRRCLPVGGSGRGYRLILLAVAEAAISWLHALGPLFGGSIAIALALLVIRRDLAWRDWAALCASQILAALIYLPALFITLGQASEWIGSTWLNFTSHGLRQDLGLLYFTWGMTPQIVAAVAALIGTVAIAKSVPVGMRSAAALLILAILPTLASIVLSLTIAPVFLVRTLSPVMVPAMLLIAAGLSALDIRRWLVVPVAVYLIQAESAVDLRLVRQGAQQNWYGAVDWLTPRMHPGDIIWAYPNETALPLAYALRDRKRVLPVRPIPAPVPAFGVGGFYVAGSRGVVSLYPSEIAALVRSRAGSSPPTIWLVRLSAWEYDRDDRLLSALRANRCVAGRMHSDQIDIVGLSRTTGPCRP